MFGAYYPGQSYPGQSGGAGAVILIFPQSTLHGQTATSTTLIQAHLLGPNDTLHGHSADSPTIIENKIVIVDNTLHGHSVDSAVFTQNHVLAVDAAIHDHTSLGPTLDQQQILQVDDATHAHYAETVTMMQFGVIVVQSTTHAHGVTETTIGVYEKITPRSPRVAHDNPMVRRRDPVIGPAIKDHARKLNYSLPPHSALVDDPVALVDDPDELAGRYVDYLRIPSDPAVNGATIRVASEENNKPKGAEVWQNSPRRSPASPTSTPILRLRPTTTRTDTTKSTPKLKPSPQKSARMDPRTRRPTLKK